MRTTLKILTVICCLALPVAAQEEEGAEPDYAKAPEPPSAEAIAARKVGIETAWDHALDTAHQIAASQGYRWRATGWAARLPDEGFSIIPLQLFAGNDYYIVLGTDASAEDISAALFDPDRTLVKAAPDRGGERLVLHVSPKTTGRHYLRLHHKKPPPKPVHCAVTYLYR
jgi:hypothetical protein